MFITGSNSYLLSGELMTNLTGRYVEIEMFTLSFSEYLEMHELLDKPLVPEQQLFRDFLRYGGFPKALEYNDPQAKVQYTEDVVGQIIDKDIRTRHKIRNRSTFEKVMSYIINNFAAPTNLTGISDYLRNTQGIPIKRETLASYIELLVKAKLLYRCNRFDIKSKRLLQGGEKYHLADTGIYFARNGNATMDCGPLLKNAVFTYLKSKDYRVSVGQIGKLEVDFIARKVDEGYFYIQVSMSVADKSVEEREYRPFSKVQDNYPQYLLTLDPLPLERDGVTHRNLIEPMTSDGNL